MAKVPATWKHDEAEIAEKFSLALNTQERYDHTCKRIPLSGSNNRRTDGTPHRGDISLPEKIDMLVECKRRATAAHQTFMDNAMKDAAKHGITTENTVLAFKVKRQRGFTIMLTDNLFFKLLSLPGAAELLERNTDDKLPAVVAKPRRPRAPKQVRKKAPTDEG